MAGCKDTAPKPRVWINPDARQDENQSQDSDIRELQSWAVQQVTDKKYNDQDHADNPQESHYFAGVRWGLVPSLAPTFQTH